MYVLQSDAYISWMDRITDFKFYVLGKAEAVLRKQPVLDTRQYVDTYEMPRRDRSCSSTCRTRSKCPCCFIWSWKRHGPRSLSIAASRKAEKSFTMQWATYTSNGCRGSASGPAHRTLHAAGDDDQPRRLAQQQQALDNGE